MPLKFGRRAHPNPWRAASCTHIQRFPRLFDSAREFTATRDAIAQRFTTNGAFHPFQLDGRRAIYRID